MVVTVFNLVVLPSFAIVEYNFKLSSNWAHCCWSAIFDFHHTGMLETRQPSTQAFSSGSPDSTWCEMLWRHRVRSVTSNLIPRARVHLRSAGSKCHVLTKRNAASRNEIGWRHEISRQVVWARRERLGTRLGTKDKAEYPPFPPSGIFSPRTASITSPPAYSAALIGPYTILKACVNYKGIFRVLPKFWKTFSISSTCLRTCMSHAWLRGSRKTTSKRFTRIAEKSIGLDSNQSQILNRE